MSILLQLMKVQNMEIARCLCGSTVGLFFKGGRYWCADCIWKRVEQLQAIVDSVECRYKLLRETEDMDSWFKTIGQIIQEMKAAK